MLSHQIRSAFLRYFAENGHEIVASSPLIPQDDETTLLFTNSGMAPFKNWFTGAEQAKFKRVATAQKCMRAGGKHNDLDNVGHTARHHTFFEMLGNFSFGDYFKADAIEMAWNFLTRELNLDKDKLYITVYAEDEEAFSIWRDLTGFGEAKILRIATNDNFWSMGNTGPCGPCSEIFYDHGARYQGGKPGTPEADGDRFIEIWNLVFMQYEQKADGSLHKLTKPCIDTGMGLERLAAVMQGVNDNYATDVLRKIIEDSQILAQDSGIERNITAHKVISDHLRSICFLIADGVLPSNEGRGYVLRRIIRRAMRYANMLQAKDFTLFRLASSVIREMGDFYSELRRAGQLIINVLEVEEANFQETLKKGLLILNNSLKSLELSPNKVNEEANDAQSLVKAELPGQLAFTLYDTYGFPLDLTEDIARTHGLAVNKLEFDAAMAKQRDVSRANWGGAGGKAIEQLWWQLSENHPQTEFYGHTLDNIDAKVLVIVKNGEIVSQLKSGESGIIICNQTVCYAESGGQIGDRGEILLDGAKIASIEDSRIYAGKLIGHSVIAVREIESDSKISIRFDRDFRAKVRVNHSATHLLHKALRKVLGEHVIQKGSLVTEQKLRFDFAHNKALTEAEYREVEEQVNTEIGANWASKIDSMDYNRAVEQGAMALFGEKYASQVRVVAMGESLELCGGTHVERTGDIGYFCLLSEQSIASGVRRIEALTGAAAVRYAHDKISLVGRLARNFNCVDADLETAMQNLVEEDKRKEREMRKMHLKYHLSQGVSDNILSILFNGANIQVHLLCKYIDTTQANDGGFINAAEQDAKHIADALIAQHDKSDSPALVLVAVAKNDETFILIRLGKNMEKIAADNLKANSLIAELGKKFKVRGGGNAALAQCRIETKLQLGDVMALVKDKNTTSA